MGSRIAGELTPQYSSGREKGFSGQITREEAGSNNATAEEFDSSTGGFSATKEKGIVSSLLWQGGTAFDAWLNAASTQVAQVLLTFPYSFAQMGPASGIFFQLFYGLLGSWTCFMITCLYADYRKAKEKDIPKNHIIQWFEVLDGLLGKRWKLAGLFFNTGLLFCTASIQLIACGSTVYYINDKLSKRTWTIIFGAASVLTVFIPTIHNYRIWSLLGILMTTYTAWYLTISAATHGQIANVRHSHKHDLVQYFTGATNQLYAFGGHAITVEIMHAMWKPRKFKLVYLYAILYIFTLTIPSATTMYWAFGDILIHNSNAFSVLPRTRFRDAAVVLMLMHQLIVFGIISIPVYLLWEKALRIHHSKNFILRAILRIPVVLSIWFISLMIPFFGPINSAVGSLLVTFSVYILPCAAHMIYYRSSTARKNAVEQPPLWIRSWTLMYVVNTFIIICVVVLGVGFGGWASVTNIVKQVHTFGLFAKCFQCPKKS